MKTEVRSKLEAMRSDYEQLDRTEIEKLKWKELGDFTIDQVTYLGAVWAEDWEDQLLLVVELKKKRRFFSFVGETNCIGSLINDEGTITHVNEEFMWNELGYP